MELAEAFDFSLSNAPSIQACFWKVSHWRKVWFDCPGGAQTYSYSGLLVRSIAANPAYSLTCPSSGILCQRVEVHVSPNRAVPNERTIIIQPILCCWSWTLQEVLQTRQLSCLWSVSLSFEFSKNLLFKSAQLPSNWVQRTPRFLPDIGWRCHQGCLWVYGGNTNIAWALNTQSRGKTGFVTLKLECSVSCSLPHGLLHTHSSLSLPPPRFSPPFLCIPELNLMKMHKKSFYSVKCNPSTHTSYILCRNESISAGKADKSI